MKVLEFRKINVNDRCDIYYEAWSRIYEYPLVLDKIEEYKNNESIRVHNTSWGFEGVHVKFKEKLDSLLYSTIHSDIKPSNLSNTEVWDILHNPKEEYIESFDVVLNVSTVEEVRGDHISIFNNLYSQVKDGGILIMTFDLPGLQLDKFEDMLKLKIKDYGKANINGNVSKLSNSRYGHLNCGILVVKRDG